VKLHSIVLPEMEFDHPDKGDALYAMELALSLEKVCATCVTRFQLFGLYLCECDLRDIFTIPGHFRFARS
jgi:hypothetical protein